MSASETTTTATMSQISTVAAAWNAEETIPPTAE